MRRSRVSTILVDAAAAEASAAAGFWSAALGAGTRTLRGPGRGHLLCVIPRHSEQETFERLATVWP